MRPVSVRRFSAANVGHPPSVVVVAGGFEKRARRLAEIAGTLGIPEAEVVLIRYVDVGDRRLAIRNDAQCKRLRKLVAPYTSSSGVKEVAVSMGDIAGYASRLRATLAELAPTKRGPIWIDVTGIPGYGIAATLHSVRHALPFFPVVLFYTEAEKYYPTEAEFRVALASGDLAGLRPAITAHMADNLILDIFAGVQTNAPTCLFVFVGYEPHRTVGVIEYINPGKLVLVYGEPGRVELKWRQDLSRFLHREYFRSRVTAVESVSTLQPAQSFNLLERYYEMLYEDHNIVVSPTCSKMQVVGAYLFWEQYRDVQLAFPMPVTYLLARTTTGAGTTFRVTLPPVPGLVGGEWARVMGE